MLCCAVAEMTLLPVWAPLVSLIQRLEAGVDVTVAPLFPCRRAYTSEQDEYMGEARYEESQVEQDQLSEHLPSLC